jgi:hypothetical protein
MTHIEQAIGEAEAAGWKPLWKTSEFESGSHLVQRSVEMAFLDPFFWQALGKARGWGELKLPNRSPIGQHEEGRWFFHWHRFIDHLAEGKDAESFFESL